ncbi:hypothetical protein EWM64_g4266 [Hericium alpestre]|uniref:DUF8191 domain-containing protein n=1 Tax=Hericium alpestre TaxID=135208 RepID=A0A4Y9ZZY9_9AGAM|nr:hypothetical protein EWM64_g4266 [Hericium alpestre]
MAEAANQDYELISKEDMIQIIATLRKENFELNDEVKALRTQAEINGGVYRMVPEAIRERDPWNGLAQYMRSPATLRCTRCAWEVIEGFCQSCHLEHAYNEEEEKQMQRLINGSMSTENEVVHGDRQLAPRGTTPLLDVTSDHVPVGWNYRADEYRALLARGATPAMCETFQLEFERETGIVAWADEAIFEDYSGARMKPGDRWKICLGRFIVLEEDDEDGSWFMETLLDEATFHMVGFSATGWESVLESEGVWVTRPIRDAEAGADGIDNARGGRAGATHGSNVPKAKPAGEDKLPKAMDQDVPPKAESAESSNPSIEDQPEEPLFSNEYESPDDSEDEDMKNDEDSEEDQSDSEGSVDSDSDSEMLSGDEQTLLQQSQLIVELQNQVTLLRNQVLCQNKVALADDEELDSSDDENDLPSAILDEEDPDVLRCTECAWEVVDGFCQNCGLAHNCETEEVDGLERHIHGSISTDNELLDSDRQLAPRGTTPLLNVRAYMDAPGQYCPRDEYEALLARGASRLMCETFRLRFSHAKGIVALADNTLFDEFSGPRMKPGDRWIICLGRRIILDEDDPDGSGFIEGLLEEAMLFPIRWSWRFGTWETVRESEGIWVTRPFKVGAGEEENDTTDEEPGDPMDEDEKPEANDNNMPDAVGVAEEQGAVVIDEYEDEELSGDVDPELEPFWYRRRYRPVSDGNDDDVQTTDGSADEWSDSESSADSDFDEDEVMSGDEQAVPQLKTFQP